MVTDGPLKIMVVSKGGSVVVVNVKVPVHCELLELIKHRFKQIEQKKEERCSLWAVFLTSKGAG